MTGWGAVRTGHDQSHTSKMTGHDLSHTSKMTGHIGGCFCRICQLFTLYYNDDKIYIICEHPEETCEWSY